MSAIKSFISGRSMTEAVIDDGDQDRL